jgi:cell wall-associated NlpC family hydrolase/3D (Asp-Asp-Asp) domain-containing protein
MAEEEKQQVGDGADNYGQAASQMAKAAGQSGQAAAKQAGKEAAKQAAKAGAEATANTSAAVVQAGVEGGKAVAQVAAGTAVGGPWGAILSALWALRHTLFKILVFLCLLLLLFIVMIVSLPSILMNAVFGLDGTAVDMENPVTLQESYNEMSGAVSDVVDQGYNRALEKVEQIIQDGGYDYDLSMEALINYAQSSAGYDVSYILAAYSASLQQQGTSEADMVAKLEAVMDDMFPVTYEEKQQERLIPVSYTTYQAVTLTVVTSQTQTGTIDGTPQYRYTTESRTYYEPAGVQTSEEPVTTTAYNPVTVSLPVYSDGTVTGTSEATYYEAAGSVTLNPETEIIRYVECTIHPFDESVIIDAFGIDEDATYDQFGITYAEAIDNMAKALKMTLYGAASSGEAVELTDAELIAFVERQNCNATRKYILSTGLSLVGKVPYFWGGKSGPGWNEEWNTPKVVTAEGSSSTGTIRPYGLDCSGFTTWVYNTALGVNIGAGTSGQYPNTVAISEAELLPGDLGFLAESDGSGWNHVLMFAGYSETGERMWVHCSSGSGVILNTPSYDSSIVLRRLTNVDYDAPVPETGTGGITGEPMYTLEVDVTHYCACSLCCGENAAGITASGKPVAEGMVAMSSYYPFGTKIEINGVMYTVEDRGGSGIENDIHRVDIYVPDHQQALRLGRYTTTATIYSLGGE